MNGQYVDVIAIGDLHGSWDEDDESFYREADAELVLWTGDLADDIRRQREVAASLARLGPRAMGILGNHDGAFPLLAKYECVKAQVATRLLAWGHAGRVRHLRRILGKSEIAFDVRDFPECDISLIGLRPHTSGGYPMSFGGTLRREYRVTEPILEFRRLIDEAGSDRLILLGHNGPAGVGSRRTSPFGADWQSDGGDGGDEDFADAIRSARRSGKRVILAIGGHMHNHDERSDNGSTREALGWLGQVPVLNACWNPRIQARANGRWHYHYEVRISADGFLECIHRVAWCTQGSEELRRVVYEI